MDNNPKDPTPLDVEQALDLLQLEIIWFLDMMYKVSNYNG